MEATDENMMEIPATNKDSTANETKNEPLAIEDESSRTSQPNGVGERMRLLRNSLDMTVKRCVAKDTVQRLFFKNYPGLAKQHRKSLEGIHKQYTEQLESIIKDEIALMFDEEGLEGFLNDLEQLSQSSNPDQVAWRPSGKPDDDIRTHLLVVKLKQRAKLEQILKEETEEGERLQEILVAKRRHLLKSHDKCQQSTQQLQQAASDLPTDGIESLLTKHHLQNNNQP